ncbi:MAG: hypothetical protein HQL24_07000 [Candidatus Omnitrophica bacterium]|nr:hypothetical protein [Candidatus Omnitrophota bacterium]
MPQQHKIGSIYVMTIILSACSILYELLIAQAVVSLATNMVVFYSLTIGLYLISMGLGALYFHRHFKGQGTWELLFRVEMALAIIGSLSVFIVYFAHMLAGFCEIRFFFLGGTILFLGLVMLTIIMIGFLTGLEVPLLLRLGQELRTTQVINRILAFDYFGSLLGGVLFPLVLLPHFELIQIGLAVGFINLLVALFILFMRIEKKVGLMEQALSGLLVVVFSIAFLNAGNIEQFFLKKYYYYKETSESFVSLFDPMDKYPTIERYASPYQKIDIVQVPPIASPYWEILRVYSNKYHVYPDAPTGYILFLDGFFQLWSDFEEVYHEYFAHVPVALNGKVPQDVLVLGAGDGMLMRELVKYPGIKTITQVDIDRTIVELARVHPLLRWLNNNVMADSRVKVIIADAYPFLRNNQKKFDAIYMDFPAPFDYNLSKLYSREFYSFAFKSLKDDGYAVLDAASLKALSDEKDFLKSDAQMYFHTLKAAGFQTIHFFTSRLEQDNPEALALMRKAIGDSNQLVVKERADGFGIHREEVNGQEAIAQHLLSSFMTDQEHQFIFLKKEKQASDPQYGEIVSDLFVLNKARVFLSINQSQIEAAAAEPSYVNSILRPTIPNISYWWRIKFPY